MIKLYYFARRNIGGCLIFIICTVLFLGEYSRSTLVEQPKASEYGRMVGREYRVVAPLNAYGIYEDSDKKAIAYVTLIPSVRIGGPEVAFERQITKGQTVKVLGAWREENLLNTNLFYTVSIQDADFPNNLQIRIKLSRGNETRGADLNPDVYEAITRK